MKDYDVVVIGSGAGGGVAAWVFAKAGQRVLLLDRGEAVDDDPRDLLRNHRNSRYGHNTGPQLLGNDRTFQSDGGLIERVSPNEGAYNNNAMALGGGTVVYGAQAWRFHPTDFKMASTYGVPNGSSLADWPIDYEELAPFYEEIEHTLGVSGGPESGKMPPRSAYPMPPLPLSPRGERLARAAESLGWSHQRVPLMVNSQPFAGRPACLQCGQCVGFLCPDGSRASTRETVIAWAQATGLLEIWTSAQATKILCSQRGQASSVRVVRDGRTFEVTADRVVVAAGAIESARLLLLSANEFDPEGIGNSGDQVGRNLQGHYYPGAFGLFDDIVVDGYGPGPTVSVLEFNHGNPGIVGGGMLADDFHVIPSVFARDYRPPGVPDHGPALKEYVRHAYQRCFRVTGPVQDIPSPESRVTLDPSVLDRNGAPVARLSGRTHLSTVETATAMMHRAEQWMEAAGAKQVWSHPPGHWLSAGQHQAGTCRMGSDPRSSVVDSQGRVHGYENLYVCDASVHVTNGGFNPFLTVMATALRTARLAASQG